MANYRPKHFVKVSWESTWRNSSDGKSTVWGIRKPEFKGQLCVTKSKCLWLSGLPFPSISFTFLKFVSAISWLHMWEFNIYSSFLFLLSVGDLKSWDSIDRERKPSMETKQKRTGSRQIQFMAHCTACFTLCQTSMRKGVSIPRTQGKRLGPQVQMVKHLHSSS